MFTTILALALCGQSAPRNEIADLAPNANADLVAKQRTRRNARYRAGLVREKRDAAEARKVAAAQQAAFQRALPLLMEQQRQELMAMDAARRNAALERIAAGNERIANAIYWDATARQNARLGYSTPALLPGTPGYLYGPYGALIYGDPALGNRQVPVDNGNRFPGP